jgi:hypothetical protein
MRRAATADRLTSAQGRRLGVSLRRLLLSDLKREAVGRIARELMEAEISARVGARRRPDRPAQRIRTLAAGRDREPNWATVSRTGSDGHRWESADGLVQAGGVAPTDLLDDGQLELRASAPDAVCDELALEGVDEALRHSIVIGVADRADARQAP